MPTDRERDIDARELERRHRDAPPDHDADRDRRKSKESAVRVLRSIRRKGWFWPGES